MLDVHEKSRRMMEYTEASQLLEQSQNDAAMISGFRKVVEAAEALRATAKTLHKSEHERIENLPEIVELQERFSAACEPLEYT